MANDPFDGMISSGMAAPLFAASNMYGQSRAQQSALEQSGLARQQGAFQFMLERDARERSDRLGARQFDLQLAREDRAAGLQREENAFARLNSALDRQLQAAELESKDRQQAFENSLRAMSVSLDTKVKGMQLKQFDDFIKKQELVGKIREKRVAFLTGANSDPGRIRDDVSQLLSESGVGGLLTKDEFAEITALATASGQMASRYTLSEHAAPGAMISEAEVDASLGSSDIVSGEVTPAALDAWGQLMVRSGAAARPTIDEKVGALREYIAAHPNVPHLKAAGANLDGGGEATIRAWLSTGILKPALDRGTYMQVSQHLDALARTEAQLDAKVPLWRGGAQYERVRATMRRMKEDGMAEALAGSNPMAKAVMGGMVADFSRDLHGQVRKVAEEVTHVNDVLYGARKGEFTRFKATMPKGVPERSIVGAIGSGLSAVPFGVGPIVRANVRDRRLSALDMAADRIEDIRMAMVATGSTPDPDLVVQAQAARTDYLNALDEIYEGSDGKVPLALYQQLSFRRLFPARYAEVLDENARAENPNYPKQVDLDSILMSEQPQEQLPPVLGGGSSDSGFPWK